VLGAFVKTVLPLSAPAILTVIIFAFTLTMQECGQMQECAAGKFHYRHSL
jgi:ABC-type molybdate transport system permease subunit